MKNFGIGIVVLVFALTACKEEKKTNANSGDEAPVERLDPTPTEKNEAAGVQAPGPESSTTPTASGAKPKVELTTNMGKIVIELNPAKAPKSVANFLAYVKSGHYAGTIFHRVISGFMIQGGGFTADMKQKKTNAPIKNEADNGLKNTRGTIAMARTNVVDSATCQFFINVVDNGMLNHRNKSPRGWGYTVFGHVTQGMGIVDKIRRVPTGVKNGMRDVPNTPVVIQKARIL